jgi:citrate lyase beta subunit
MREKHIVDEMEFLIRTIDRAGSLMRKRMEDAVRPFSDDTARALADRVVRACAYTEGFSVRISQLEAKVERQAQKIAELEAMVTPLDEAA